MPSPFPGMDPYLEDPAYWSDFHWSILVRLGNLLNERLPDHYEGRLQRVDFVETSPDLLIEKEQHETRLEILQLPERSLIGVVELLSPANKEEPGLHRYRDKRFALLQQNVHIVEIDLLLAGRRLPLHDALPAGDYYVLISRGDQRPNCQVYAWTMCQPLPTILLPLKAPDPDLRINLGEVFNIAYDRGRYRRSLKYGDPPVVHLPAPTREWVVQQARQIATGPVQG